MSTYTNQYPTSSKDNLNLIISLIISKVSLLNVINNLLFTKTSISQSHKNCFRISIYNMNINVANNIKGHFL